MNQQWRRNIKKAAKQGVEVSVGSGAADLKAFHDLYVHTARRDHFTPRPLSYFETMFAALRSRLYVPFDSFGQASRSAIASSKSISASSLFPSVL